MQALHGMRAVSSVTAVGSLLAQSPSSPTKTSTTVCPATRKSSLHAAHAVKRWLLQLSISLKEYTWEKILEINRISSWPLTCLISRPCLKVGWPTGTSRGIRSALCAPAARPSWQVNTLLPETTALTASSALATCMPKSVRPATNPSQARSHYCVPPKQVTMLT